MNGTIYGQQTAISYYDSITESTTISLEEKNRTLKELLQNYDSISANDQAQLNYQYWKRLWKQGKKEGAKKYVLREFELRKSINNKDLLKRNLYNLGYVHSRLDIPEREKALHYFDTLLEMTAKTESRLGTIYREKGDLYDHQGDFQRALENYQNAERIQKEQDLKGRLIKTYINISGTYAKRQDSVYFDDFIINNKKLEVLSSMYQISNRQQVILKMNNGSMYRTKKNYKKSLASYEEGLKLAEEINDDGISFGLLNNLGIDCIKLGLYKDAASYFKKASALSAGVREREASILDNQGDLNMKLGFYEKALSNYQQAISYLLTGNKELMLEGLPSLEAVRMSPYKIDILEYLIDKSEAFYVVYQKTNEIAYLKEANKSIVLVDQIIDDLYFESREDLSKLIWREKGAKLYLMAVAICFELGDENSAFYYMEKNKGMMLLENISDARAKRLGNVTAEVIARERKFQIDLAKLQSDLFDAGSPNLVNQLKEDIFKKKEAYQTMIDSLAFSFPEYYKYKRKVVILSSDSAIKRLDAGERVLSYILGDNEGYVTLISKSGIRLKRIEEVQKLNEDIVHFRELLQKPFQSKEDEIVFQKIAFQLKQKLMPFAEFEVNDIPIRLSVVPDRSLYAVPFEALVLNAEITLSDAYLVRNFEISYHYSLSVDAQLENQNKSKQTNFIGFIPGTFQNNYRSDLNNSQTEINEIVAALDGTIFTDTMATKHNFLKAYMNSDIVHVSTHGGFDSKNPELAFYDDKLFLDELYFLNNDKELVVLSACKTSIGNEVRGEGVFNFTRGFINSGAKSVITTLWDVNEKSSSEVITSFYDHLAMGKRKSESLQLAKLNYLDQHYNTSQASPFYWSAIILTGDNVAIIETSHWKMYAWMLIVLVVLSTSVVLFRKKQSRG